ncbi:MAG: FAD-dependent oxidoreductase [Clostridium sp.]
MTRGYSDETQQGYTMDTVMEEAQRCLLCLDAPCSAACPAGTDPARFIRSVRFRNLKGAAETIRENNAIGGVCARVCPTERYCQQACSRCGIDRPIDIGGIQRFVTDFEETVGMEILKTGAANGKKIGIIGSGPSGLQAAAALLGLGYEVHIYEKSEKAGGYLRYGIPEYRLPERVVDREIEKIEKMGAEFHCGTDIGTDCTMDELKETYDAVLVAAGASVGKWLPMFEGNDRTETAVEFLARVKAKGGKEEVPDHVVVIGGGDVAMDAATTLKRLGAKRVTDVAYEELCEFLASEKELEGARQAGVTIIDGYIPEQVDGNTVTFKHRHMDARLCLGADKIILAVGQKPDVKSLGLEMERNEAKADGYRTADPEVFVTGDLAEGDKTVVWAVRKGKEAAQAIHESLQERGSRL